MSQPNILVSNGTCYTKAGVKLDASFIPCGNAAYGHVTCCGKGDNCLADNACYGHHGEGYGSDLTYFGGCTDPAYAAGSCPNKIGIDQPWIALTRCDGEKGEWAPCPQDGAPSTLQPGSFCSCTDAAKTTLAFKDTNTLSSFASLPQATGDEIQFFPGYVPTVPPGGPTGGGSSGTGGGSSGTGSPSETGAGGSSPTGGGNSPTGSDNSNNGDGSTGGGGGGLGSGAKIGIGVGVGLFFLLLLAAIVALFLRRRKRRPRTAPTPVETKPGPAAEVKRDEQRVSAISNNTGITTPTVSEAGGQAISEADGKEIRPPSEAGRPSVSEMEGTAAQPWNVRSELEGQPGVPSFAEGVDEDGVLVSEPHGVYHVRRSGELSPVAELPGSEARLGAGQGHGVQVPGARWKIQTGPGGSLQPDSAYRTGGPS